MGLFNLGKKKDPLDDLEIPKDEHGALPETNPNFHENPPFQHETPESSDPLSGVPPLQSQAPTDHFSQYQQAVQTHADSFHTTEQNIEHKESPQNTSHSQELILSKLDVIKAMIENLNHRIENLEQKYQYEKELKKKTSW